MRATVRKSGVGQKVAPICQIARKKFGQIIRKLTPQYSLPRPTSCMITSFIIHDRELIIAPSPDLQPAFFTPTPKAAKRVLEFFTAQINNDHTRRAYMNAARRFADWCAGNSIHELSRV
jgi:hypothetical protein